MAPQLDSPPSHCYIYILHFQVKNRVTKNSKRNLQEFLFWWRLKHGYFFLWCCCFQLQMLSPKKASNQKAHCALATVIPAPLYARRQHHLLLRRHEESITLHHLLQFTYILQRCQAWCSRISRIRTTTSTPPTQLINAPSLFITLSFFSCFSNSCTPWNEYLKVKRNEFLLFFKNLFSLTT